MTAVRGCWIRQAAEVTTVRRLLPGVLVGGTAIAEGLLTRGQLRRRSHRRLVQGVYADPGLPFDHQIPSDERLDRLRALGWRVVRVSATDVRDVEALVLRIRTAIDAA
jgi:hypothetical protein